MTLVAANRHSGTPVLTGDILLTNEAGAVVGERKKIQRLRRNLALGWTGFEQTALAIGQHLNATLPEDQVREAALRSALRSFPATHFRDEQVMLSGWLIDDNRELCFKWSSKSPHDFQAVEECIVGTGAFRFGGISQELKSPVGTEVPIRALKLACFFMSDEAGFWRNREKGFGHAYEILYWRDGAFQYVSDVAYTFIQAEFDSQGRFRRIFQVPWAFQARAIGEYAVVESIYTGVRPYRIDRRVISPFVGETKIETGKHIADTLLPSLIFQVPRWVCMYVAFVHAAETSSPRDLPPHLLVTDTGRGNLLDGPFFFQLLGPDNAVIKYPPQRDIEARYAEGLKVAGIRL